MARVQLLLCFTILFASVTLMDLVSAHLKFKPSMPQIEDPKTVKDIEPYTVKVVMVFVADLEKECPKTNKFKAFFEKLRGFAKYVCPIKRRDQVDYDRDMKAKAGGLFKTISSFAIGKIREEIQEEKMEAINTFRFMKSVAGKIMGGRRREENEETMKLTAEQQKEIKEGILKWQTIITRITNTMVVSATSSSSGDESNTGKEESSNSNNNKSSGTESSISGSSSSGASGNKTSSKDTTTSGATDSTTDEGSASASGKKTSSKDTTTDEGSASASEKKTSSKDTTTDEGSASASEKKTSSKDTTTDEGSASASEKKTSSKDTTTDEGSASASEKKTSSKDTTTSGGSVSGNVEASQSSSVTVQQVEADTSKQVSSFIMNLEKKCPQKEEFKAFFEQLKGTMIAPPKERKGFFSRIKSAAGKLSGAMAFMRSRIGTKSAEVKKSMEAYQEQVTKTLQELETIHSQIVSQNKGKNEGSLTCTPAQQVQIKQTITKWEQVTTQFVETAVQSETQSSSSSTSSSSSSVGKMVAN